MAIRKFKMTYVAHICACIIFSLASAARREYTFRAGGGKNSWSGVQRPYLSLASAQI